MTSPIDIVDTSVATATSVSTRPRQRIGYDQSQGEGQKHKRTLSIVSTDEIVTSSPAARRMSMSRTPQSGRILGFGADAGDVSAAERGARGWLGEVLSRPGMLVAGLISVIVT